MAKITYTDKDNEATLGTAPREFRAEDANEIKTVVNANADAMSNKPTDFEPVENEALPAVCPSGEVLFGQRFRTTRAGYLPTDDPGGKALFAKNTIMEAMEDAPGNDPAKWRYY